MIERLLQERVTIVRMGEVPDPEGYLEAVRAETSRETVPGYLEQTGERELVLDRNTEISDWLLVLGAGVTIGARDRVEWGSYVFEVVGPPSRPRTPRGEHHVEVRLRHVSEAADL